MRFMEWESFDVWRFLYVGTRESGARDMGGIKWVKWGRVRLVDINTGYVDSPLQTLDVTNTAPRMLPRGVSLRIARL